MTLESNDPRLTAYALGELDAHEAAHLEAELGESPDGQRALAEIRRMAERLHAALAGERRRRFRRPAGGDCRRRRHEGSAAWGVAGGAFASRLRPVAPVSPAQRGTRWLRRHSVSIAAVVRDHDRYRSLAAASRADGARSCTRPSGDEGRVRLDAR